ncbi:MAG: c-type cytochrome [Acidiphilium sp.]|nr:c-type cytochrome [Acidiphilium sp.]MDD4935202.1 c-type cytochrome [Acidiphilium sp.]
MKPIIMAAIFAAGLCGAASARAADVAKGKSIFAEQCAACHSAASGQNGIGPSLYGVYGKPAAMTAGFDFSPALKSAHIVWTAPALDKFLANPQSDVPGTKMPYMGMANATDRADVIAYLATLSAPSP